MRRQRIFHVVAGVLPIDGLRDHQPLYSPRRFQKDDIAVIEISRKPPFCQAFQIEKIEDGCCFWVPPFRD